MKKSLLTSFALLLGLAAGAQTTYFSQTVGSNTPGVSYNSGFASVRTSTGNFITVAASQAGGFEVRTFNSAGVMMITTKLADASVTVDNVAFASEMPDGSILVTGTGNISGAAIFYVAKINLLTNQVTITHKPTDSFSYTKGPRAVMSGSSVYVAFPQFNKWDLGKFDSNLNPVWTKCAEEDTSSGKNPGNDCGILDDTTIIVVGKCDTILGWGEYDTTGGLDSMRLFGIAGYTRVYGMGRTADGSMLLAGLNQSYTTFTTNPVLLKVAPNGSIIWSKIVDATAMARFVNAKELPDGRIIALGTTTEAYADTYFDGAIMFDASGNILNSTLFGSTQNSYQLYDIKVYNEGFLMSGVIVDNTTSAANNAMIFTDFNFSMVCDKTPVSLTVADLPHWASTVLTSANIKITAGTMPVTASYGLLTMGANTTPEICSIATGVHEIPATTAAVYPNPVAAGANLTITMSTAGTYTLNVISSTGALVSTSIANGTMATVSTQNMTTGLYIINVMQNGVRISSQKIAVK